MTEIPPSKTREEFAGSMAELIKVLASALVDHPDKVLVESMIDQDSTLVRLRVAHSDLGKVIGKQGRTARSIRTILGAASMKAQRRCSLDIQQHPSDLDPTSQHDADPVQAYSES